MSIIGFEHSIVEETDKLVHVGAAGCHVRVFGAFVGYVTGRIGCHPWWDEKVTRSVSCVLVTLIVGILIVLLILFMLLVVH